jgi:hypothetical protein
MHIHTPGSKTTRYLALIASVVLGFGLCTGCTSPGYHKGDVAAVSMHEAAQEVQAESRHLDQTLASLSVLINGTNADLGPAFKRYCQSLDQLIASAQRTAKTGKSMEQKSAAFLADWDRQLQTIDYQHIRELSDTRRTEVTNRVAAINQRYGESQAAVQPLISYLEDIRRALSIDLTPAGLESLKGVTQNAQNNMAKVQTALDALTDELTNSSAHMSSVAYQAARQNPQAPLGNPAAK